jgi:CRISPR-associated protein Cas1
MKPQSTKPQSARIDDLHALPKFRDSLSYLYVEHARIDRHENSIAVWDEEGCTPAPASSLAVLMLGPGTRITQSAVTMLADNNCLVIWCGEENVRFYACGMGGTRSASAMLHQARLVSDDSLRLQVVKQMYWMRFGTVVDTALSIEQLRGMEGARVRDTYSRMGRETGLEWTGRSYDRGQWNHADPVNRALSCANSCLYGVVHAAILSTGYSPALGFIHTGKQLSFVYDIADLYKSELTIPLAFAVAKENPAQLERAVRYRMRDAFRETRLLQRIIPDIQKVLGMPKEDDELSPLDEDPALPTDLWTPEAERSVQPGDEFWGN